ncbi:MAG: hypothetical protein QXI12_05065 [Candidatus Methanomethyliaceae archaeon]
MKRRKENHGTARKGVFKEQMHNNRVRDRVLHSNSQCKSKRVLEREIFDRSTRDFSCAKRTIWQNLDRYYEKQARQWISSAVMNDDAHKFIVIDYFKLVTVNFRLTAADPYATNDFTAPNTVVPRAKQVLVRKTPFVAQLPPHSLVVFEFPASKPLDIGKFGEVQNQADR